MVRARRVPRRSVVSGVPAALAVVLAAFGLSACGSAPPPKPQATVAAYVAAWSLGQWPAMAALVDQPPTDFASIHSRAWSELGVHAAAVTAGPISQQGGEATTTVTSRLAVPDFGTLVLHSSLSLTEVAKRWLVDWSPQTIAYQFGQGDSFALARTWPARAPIVGAGGATLTPTGTLVTIGLVGQRITDAATLSAALVAAGLPQEVVAAGIAQAQRNPTQFSALETIPQASYLPIKAQIYPLPGTAFETTSGQAPLSPDLGAHIVGQTGPITAQQLASLGSEYNAGDVVGQSGIEAAYQQQLAGQPATVVNIVDSGGHIVAVVGQRGAVLGRPVQTTIEPAVQAAAEAALNGVTEPAAIVVMQASTGDLLASVSRPISQAFDLALDGAVPPGSTFKVITTTALLKAGASPATAATCPPSIVVDGKAFSNYEKETLASLTLEEAFAVSCNTAFIGLTESAGLTGASLTTAARLFGIGGSLKMGLSAYTGSVGSPSGPVDIAASAIGQGQVLVSPLGMATVAATVDSGELREPRLVMGAPDDSMAPVPLDPTVDEDLKLLMGQVVTSPLGTAAGAGLPSGTYGKTGTAEFGPGATPATHAWFIGFRGNIAFAVVVYGGGVGGQVAAPLAAKLLNALPAG